MGSFNLTVVFLLLIIKLSSCSDNHPSVKCIQTEREALLSFKEGLNRSDEYGQRSFYWVGEDCCKWSGIECNNKSGDVTKLVLQNWGLVGKTSSSLIHLKYLNYSDFSGNDFNWIQIPEFFGMLENLMYLNLSYTYFSWEIPLLKNLSRLTHLDLSNSLTYAENLDWLSRLSTLKYLGMGHVDLSGVGANWLHAVNRLPSLVELHLGHCKLESLPTSLPLVNLTSLVVLDLSFNQFNSSIPQWLVNLTSLIELDLSFNNIQDAIAFDYVNLRNLKHLYLSGNRYLTGRDGARI